MKKYYLLAALILTAFNPLTSYASADCEIWLCLPAGFPAGCGAAKTAFNKRIRHGRPPLPPFMSCAITSSESSNMTYKSDRIYWKPATQCSRGSRLNPRCSTPAQWTTQPCQSIACRSKNRITIQADGENIGTTFIY